MNTTFTALSREAALAAEHIGIGATSLSRANLTKPACYAQAFFALSVGFERSAKLAIAADHAIKHGGAFPTSGDFKSYGHKLDQLIAKTWTIAEEYENPDGDYPPPSSPLHAAIIAELTSFANNKTRYYNLEILSKATAGSETQAEATEDPISSWHNNVTLPILKKHVKPKTIQRIALEGQGLQDLIGPLAVVSHTGEDGQAINSLAPLYSKTATVEHAQKYVRMYVLQIARRLAILMSSLGKAGYGLGSPNMLIPELSEFFYIFNQDDYAFKRRKTWSII